MWAPEALHEVLRLLEAGRGRGSDALEDGVREGDEGGGLVHRVLQLAHLAVGASELEAAWYGGRVGVRVGVGVGVSRPS